MTKLIFISLLNVLLFTGCNINQDKTTYDSKQLQEDLDYMIKTMEEVHPNLYFYLPKEIFILKVDSVKKSINRQMTRIEFHSFITPLIKLLDIDKFVSFLDSTFIVINQDSIEHLIIDIRKNGGGNSTLGDSLLTYLVDEPFKQFFKVYVHVSQQIKDHIIVKGEDTTNNNYKRILNAKIGTDVEWIEPINYPKGKAYVLIGPRTDSSAMLSTTIKDYQIATLIGEETGGKSTFYGYGDMYNFELPNTKLKCGVSLCYFVRPGNFDDGHGALPDYEIKTTEDDKKSGKDPVFVLRLLEKQDE